MQFNESSQIQDQRASKEVGTGSLDRRFCTAPMMDWSDRHCRHFWRRFTSHSLLYTEMVTTGALIHAENPERFLIFHPEEHPLALQLGGSNPAELATCALKAQAFGYDEVNLNVGCPSDRVQNNRIGACLMADPERVKSCLASMLDRVDIPVTVKHRIGIDDQDSYQQLVDFVGIVAESGCTTFIVHARKAILQGLSPKENREIPPLQYERVYQLKRDFPHLEIIINGGIKSVDEAKQHLEQVDGVMIGREAYQNPWMLADVDSQIYGQTRKVTDKVQAYEYWLPYIRSELAKGTPLQHLARHTLGLFHAQKGARQFRRYLSENAHRQNAGLEVIDAALEFVR